MKCKLIAILILTNLYTLINGTALDLAMMENLPGYAVTIGIEQLNATKCRTEMEQYRDAISHRILWSLAMLDSSGQPSPGFIGGDNYWTGSKSQCDYLKEKQLVEYAAEKAKNYSLYRNPADELPPFTVNFFGAYIRHNGTMQYHFSIPVDDVIVLGLCLPDSCTEHEIAIMLNKVFDDRLLLFGHLYLTDFELIKVSNLNDNYTWLLNGKIITIIVILGVWFGTVIVGTFYDVFLHQKRLRKLKEFRSDEKNVTELNADMEQNLVSHTADIVQGNELEENLKDNMQKKSEHDKRAVQMMKPVSRIERVLISFSIISNMKQIFQLKTSSEDIAAFHALKVFGASWLILFHIPYFTTFVTGNKIEIYRKNVSTNSQSIINGAWAVETFFFLAGFLLAVGHFKLQRNGRKIVPLRTNVYNFLAKIIKRFIRLTPPYVVTMMLSILIFSWTNNSLMTYFVEPITERCMKYWWRNILYINNLFHWDSICMVWSWYLSNDMQFYIFSAFLLNLSVSHSFTAMSLGIVTVILSMLSTGYVTYEIGHVKTLESRYETISYIYIPPWIRIIPYILGMGTALILEKLNYKLHLSKIALVGGWFISISCFYWVIYGPASITTSHTATIIYETFSRLGWNLASAWLVIVCLTNNAATLNKFLSLPCWIPGSRVSYCVYLLNPIFVLLYDVLSNHTQYMEAYFVIITGLGVCAITFISAFILSAAVEMPTISLLRWISSSSTNKK